VPATIAIVKVSFCLKIEPICAEIIFKAFSNPSPRNTLYSQPGYLGVQYTIQTSYREEFGVPSKADRIAAEAETFRVPPGQAYNVVYSLTEVGTEAAARPITRSQEWFLL
jgi:hypothetical protein